MAAWDFSLNGEKLWDKQLQETNSKQMQTAICWKRITAKKWSM